MKRPSLPCLLAAVALAMALGDGATAEGPPASGPFDRLAVDPPGFGSCISCHGGQLLNSGDGGLRFEDVPEQYVPGTTYPLRITLQDPGQSRWGFEMVAIDDSGKEMGSLVPIDPLTQASFDPLSARTYVKHTEQGTFRGQPDGPVSWAVNWIAPPAGAGTARFYGAGLAANDNGLNSGDFVYSAATASAESGSGTEVSVLLQPDDASPQRSSLATVQVRVRNHGVSSASVFLVTRVVLDNGTVLPPSGSLEPPFALDLLPGEQRDLELGHAVPSMAPFLFSATYEALVGRPPAQILARDSFSFTVVP